MCKHVRCLSCHRASSLAALPHTQQALKRSSTATLARFQTWRGWLGCRRAGLKGVRDLYRNLSIALAQLIASVE